MFSITLFLLLRRMSGSPDDVHVGADDGGPDLTGARGPQWSAAGDGLHLCPGPGVQHRGRDHHAGDAHDAR